MLNVFFFQAEDGIRDADVTGVQTCALPIFLGRGASCKGDAGERSKYDSDRSGHVSLPLLAIVSIARAARGRIRLRSRGQTILRQSRTLCPSRAPRVYSDDFRMSQAPVRIEHDLLGERAVPAEAYYGIHTLRALENFPITGTPISIYPELVRALACVKQAAALANGALGLLSDEKAQAIARACEQIREGELLEEFVVDVIQGGAGTSTNMNANEVVANRAL